MRGAIRGMFNSKRAARACACLALLPLLSCARSAPDQPASLREMVERGPIRLTASVAPAEPVFGDTITLTLEVQAPTDYSITFPETGELAEVAPTQAGEQTRKRTGDTTIWMREYKLSPESTGELEIPALPVEYQASAGATQPAAEPATELLSPALKITIRSVLTPQDAPQNPREITGVLAPPPRRLTLLEWALIGAGAVIAALLVLLFVRAIIAWRRRPPLPIPADQAALAALDALQRQPLQTQAQMRSYHYALSEIVRQYIERAFGIAAPEMTTEEFLRSIGRSTPARGSGAPLIQDATLLTLLVGADLRPFLEQCDLVKYAALAPSLDDAQRALSEARAFIQRTAAAQKAAAAAAPSAGAAQAGATAASRRAQEAA